MVGSTVYPAFFKSALRLHAEASAALNRHKLQEQDKAMQHVLEQHGASVPPRKGIIVHDDEEESHDPVRSK